MMIIDWVLFGMGALRLCHSSVVVLPGPGLFGNLHICTSLVWGVSYTFWWLNGRWLPISDVCEDCVRNLSCFYLDLRPFGHFSALFSKGFAAKMVGWPTNWLWAFLWICDPWAVPSGEHVTTTVNHCSQLPVWAKVDLPDASTTSSVETWSSGNFRGGHLPVPPTSDISEGLRSEAALRSDLLGLWFFKYFPKVIVGHFGDPECWSYYILYMINIIYIYDICIIYMG